MMRLTRVELRRLFSRRLTTIALLGALIVTGVMLFGTYMEAKPVSGAQLASQKSQFDQAHRDWVANGDQQLADCLTQQAETQKTDPNANFGCNQMEPKWESWGKPQAEFPLLMPGVLIAGSYLLIFVGFLVGASFVAAEFSSGSMANWLTFEPRRMPVFASKLAAAGLGLIPATVAVLGLLTAGAWVIVGHFGSTAGTTPKIWGDLGEMGARALVLALAATVTGAAIGVLLRRTVAVLGVAIGYLVLVAGCLRSESPERTTVAATAQRRRLAESRDVLLHRTLHDRRPRQLQLPGRRTGPPLRSQLGIPGCAGRVRRMPGRPGVPPPRRQLSQKAGRVVRRRLRRRGRGG